MALRKAVLNKINTIEIISIEKILGTDLTDDEFNYMKRLLNENPKIYDIIEDKINKFLFKYKKEIYDSIFIIELIIDIYQRNKLSNTTGIINLINISHFTFYDIILESKIFLDLKAE